MTLQYFSKIFDEIYVSFMTNLWRNSYFFCDQSFDEIRFLIKFELFAICWQNSRFITDIRQTLHFLLTKFDFFRWSLTIFALSAKIWRVWCFSMSISRNSSFFNGHYFIKINVRYYLSKFEFFMFEFSDWWFLFFFSFRNQMP